MKTYRIFGIAICTGSKAELDKIAQVAAGTHHVHRNQKGGPRKRKVSEGLKAIGSIPGVQEALKDEPKCEHGKGMTDYCEPCGRIHGGSHE